MLKLSVLFIALVFTVSCSTDINSIKKQYYSIDTINGIDKEEEREIAFNEEEPINESVSDRAKITRIPRDSGQEESLTSSVSDNPAYDLKLLSGGFEADFNNHITLKPDHSMDFSDDPSDAGEFTVDTGKGDTITVRGATRGNRGIIRLMKETVINGLRTRVSAFKLNGTQITQLIKNLELTPGKHTLTSRCYSSQEDAFDKTNNVFENKIEVVITNAHEYLLEAQTYQLRGEMECAASVYDLRDAR